MEAGLVLGRGWNCFGLAARVVGVIYDLGPSMDSRCLFHRVSTSIFGEVPDMGGCEKAKSRIKIPIITLHNPDYCDGHYRSYLGNALPKWH